MQPRSSGTTQLGSDASPWSASASAEEAAVSAKEEAAVSAKEEAAVAVSSAAASSAAASSAAASSGQLGWRPVIRQKSASSWAFHSTAGAERGANELPMPTTIAPKKGGRARAVALPPPVSACRKVSERRESAAGDTIGNAVADARLSACASDGKGSGSGAAAGSAHSRAASVDAVR